ncbi:cholecystokinin receptor type A [Drosophila gunungcola]|uniref:cholecystokinin receptor type A n=1 Tax=Drosophila gunungcola TaxID=103775 RepID=UPI0022E2D39A|nr:cholecystokinin receptor type A [Drosophila gunungcola]XP_052855745.1 cholecystokinin receptor type A [Drosophila gunungcola]
MFSQEEGDQVDQAANAISAAYRALLDYYANAPSASGHIVSLTVGQPYNDTGFGSGSVSGSGYGYSGLSNSTPYAEDYFATQQLESELVTEAANLYFGTSFSSVPSPSASPSPSSSSSSTSTTGMPVWLIPSYSVILLFAVLGNLLVISTLVQNRRMRTITNVFLLNLAISDMLLGVLCMPVTLVGTLLRHFIFGEFLCKLFQFSQAASVAVSSWTLVAISCERYYAICHPLRSRSWQTISHAYKIIGFIWLGGILCMTPIAIFSQLLPTSRPGYCKCRETWPDQGYELCYTILLDFLLLVLPLLVLCVAYILITRTLYVGMAKNNGRILQQSAPAVGGNGGGGGGATTPGTSGSNNCILVLTATAVFNENSNNNNGNAEGSTNTATTTLTTRAAAPTVITTTTTTTVTLAKTSSPSIRVHDAALRRSNEAKTLESKKRVVKMLFVLVLEFFICWTPLYVINTMSMLIGPVMYQYVDYTAISFLQLLAYSSSCCNPITYCFMNASFRRAFVDTFKGLPWRRGGGGGGGAGAGAGAGGLSVSQAAGYPTYPNATNISLNPGLAMGKGTWRTRSRHEFLNSVVHTTNAAAATSTDSPQL